MMALFDWLWLLALFAGGAIVTAGEAAILVADRSRLRREADEGSWAARLAWELGRKPQPFFAATRAANLLLAVLAAVHAAAVLLKPLAGWLEGQQLAGGPTGSSLLAWAIVGLVLTAAWLLAAEYLPRRMALANAEKVATAWAYPVHWILLVGQPLAAVLRRLADGIYRWLTGRKPREIRVQPEDLQRLLRMRTAGEAAPEAEQVVARQALRLGQRTVREIMRPRIEVDALDVDTPSNEVIGAVAMAGFSRLPIHEGDLDHIIGFVYTKDLLRQQYMGWPIELRKLLRPALLVPETLPIDKLLESFRQRRTQMAIVLDEFGGTEGLVTLDDVLEELIGEIHDEYRTRSPEEVVQEDPRTWRVGGSVNLDHFLERIGRAELRTAATGDYNTVAGLVVALLERIPQTGDATQWHNLHLEVVQMEGPRIEQILVRLPESG